MHSVVIPCYVTNTKQILMTAKCIEYAKKTSLPFELVIVETGSDYFLNEADVYINEKNKTTVTKSINRGLQAASGDYITLLTNDVYVEDGWLELLEDCFKEKDCGASTLATTQLGHKKESKIEEGIWASLFMMPKHLLEQLGYMDEKYIGSWDDTDLWMRMYLLGYKMYRNYGQTVEHLVRQTHGQDSKHMEHYECNAKLFKRKFYKHEDNRIYKILTEGLVI